MKDKLVSFFESVSVPRFLLGGLSCVFVAYALGILMLRTYLPAQLDVWEGKNLCQAADYALGNNIYNDPATHGAADIYTPLYPMLLSLWFRVAEGRSFVSGRMISLAVTILAGLLMVLFFRNRNGGRCAGLVVAALFASIAWRSCWTAAAVKPDPLCHLFWIAGLGLLLVPTLTATAFSAFLIVLGFYTKQTALFAIPGAVLFLFVDRKKHVLPFLLALAVSFVGLYGIFHVLAGDWMGFYLFGRMATKMGRLFPVADLMKHFFSFTAMPLTLTGAAVAVVLIGRLWKEPAYRLVLLSLPFLLGGSLITSASPDSNENSMLPVFYGVVFLAGFGIEKLIEDKSAYRVHLAWLMVILLAFQWDSRMPYHISKAMGRFDRDFIETVDFLKKQEGSMYSPAHNVLTEFAGRHEYDDRLLAGYISPRNPAALQRVKTKMNSGEYDWLICTVFEDDYALLTPEGRAKYRLEKDFGSWLVLKRVEGE